MTESTFHLQQLPSITFNVEMAAYLPMSSIPKSKYRAVWTDVGVQIIT